ncbi:MAG: phenylalanine--tRNA ligase subunit beta [Firmicutes bacterium]|nr:phenylalanine--tRNA ligase subunit beta [Bacillota bacterium]
MKLSINWCRDFVGIDGAEDIDIKKFCDMMTDSGSKVETYDVLGEDIKNVKVARIVKITPHPDSDHLLICQMDCGEGELHQIVTGAQNVFEGAIVPAAIPPATLPGGVKIKPGKLRGVQSDGMLCSIGELNLTSHDMPGNDNSGICILGEEFADKIGEDICRVLMLSDIVVDYEITPNRPDCLSVIGLAREAAATFDLPCHVPAPAVKPLGDGDDVSNYVKVDIEAPDLCSRYAAKVVKNVKIAPSPLWLRMRLRAMGVRPINNIVDITNYVMLEYGQPMHAFDYKCLDGAHIHVRRAGDGEIYKSLDINAEDTPLTSSMLVIADDNKPVALAGVMGGANSEITDETSLVVFESANFEGVSVRRTAKAMGIRTESSARFEKGMDPETCMPALLRACELVQMLGAGEVVDGVVDIYPGRAEPTVLPLQPDKINAFLGTDISEEYMVSALRKLSFEVDTDKSPAMVHVPTWRADVKCMSDLSEEVIRMYGYNEIETTLPFIRMSEGGRTERQMFEEDLKSLLCGMGLWESVTFSFIGPRSYDMIKLPADSPLRKSVVISNPLGEDTSVMRTTGIPTMLEVLLHNQNHKNPSAMMYEAATVYIPNGEDELPTEKKSLCIGMYGAGDFYSLKGICERVLGFAGIRSYTTVSNRKGGTYHPGRCGELVGVNAIGDENGIHYGTLGQIHPDVAKAYGLSGEIYAAELDLEAIYENRSMKHEFVHLPKYPSTSRDFSFVCDEELEAGRIESVCVRVGGKLLVDAYVFDVYRGEGLGEGKKSVSVRIVLRAPDRTLTDEEADKTAAKILSAMEKELGVTLRGVQK